MRNGLSFLIIAIYFGNFVIKVKSVNFNRPPIILPQSITYANAYPPSSSSQVDENHVIKRRENYGYGIKGQESRWGGGLLSSLTSGSFLASPTSGDNGYAYDADSYASAGSHGGGSYGHGGSGYGKGMGHNLNNSAVGLLGFLSLLSLIQTVLNQRTTTTMGPMRNRKKRRALGEELKDFSSEPKNEVDRIIQLILPLLSAVAHARDELIPIDCTLRQVCKANGILVKALGDAGRSVGSTLNNGIGKILKEVDKNGFVMKIVNKAGKAGRNGEDCSRKYRECPDLLRLPIYKVPSTTSF